MKISMSPGAMIFVSGSLLGRGDGRNGKKAGMGIALRIRMANSMVLGRRFGHESFGVANPVRVKREWPLN
jgi:hypothetical protein